MKWLYLCWRLSSVFSSKYNWITYPRCLNSPSIELNHNGHFRSARYLTIAFFSGISTVSWDVSDSLIFLNSKLYWLERTNRFYVLVPRSLSVDIAFIPAFLSLNNAKLVSSRQTLSMDYVTCYLPRVSSRQTLSMTWYLPRDKSITPFDRHWYLQ